jgi:hypothetical protein
VCLSNKLSSKLNIIIIIKIIIVIYLKLQAIIMEVTGIEFDPIITCAGAQHANP